MRIKIITLTCKNCGHKWTPTISDIKICPKCKVKSWNNDVARGRNKKWE